MLETAKIYEEISEIRAKIDEKKEIILNEKRTMTEDEEKELDELKRQISEKEEELKKLRAEMEEKQPKEDPEEDEEKEENKRNKNIRSNNMKKLSLVKEIRNAIESNQKTFTINAETRAMQVTGDAGVHDAVVETEIQGILEPLYANSVLTQLGVRWYTGLPQGDIQVPVMGKGSCGWKGEIAAADATANEFTTVLLQPKRLTAYCDISLQLLNQDTIGVESAIRRDIVNALNDQLEATVLGANAGTTTKPAGIFYNADEVNVDDYAGLCAFEAALDDANINGQKKYLMGNTAKATFRSMIKGTNATGMVLEANQIDGTPMINTSNVSTKKFCYGDFNYLALASWGNIDITVDPYTQAVNGCVRLVINAFFDAKMLRPEAFKFGNVD